MRVRREAAIYRKRYQAGSHLGDSAILKHLGLPDTLSEIAPARPPPEPEFGDDLFGVV
jgi:hypothetical protein